ncbi:barren [Trichodelitschia bisporula]|uniref:Condensin complex subunit 2 n=1 Tax=Trichodelitschia bisporula TaxID=703511 RepID=A0A6G1IAH7_9PEZI|nr:barren [Trichodelitschia bisporula]
MPRVSNAPRSRVFSGPTATPAKSPVKIPLNDDKREKANRLQSRQAQHEAQMNQIKAAATPLRKRKSFAPGTPQTPNNQRDEDGMPSVSGTAVTPMKRVPILANFEEWMKMATDNKINATNSWNFALIDYFHDMSLLREGDGVNFQKASCTLDGCVKIYTNRVDSVATETGKLLSGLADGGNKKRKDDGEEGADGENDEDEDGEEGGKRRARKRAPKSEATLATSFAQLQLKKMELEFSVDPLFKKASADFDEGGAKGLLLNHLAIDNKGRIVFDSSDDIEEATENGQDATAAAEIETSELEAESGNIDLGRLAAKFFPDLAKLDEEDICPSLKGFDFGDANGTMDLPFLKAPENWRQDTPASDDPKDSLDDDNAGGFDDDGLFGGMDLEGDVGFGEGGEVWAKEAALDAQMHVHNVAMRHDDGEADDNQGGIGGFEPANPEYTVTIRHGQDDEQENILNYFDKALQSNWAGPEHWKIRRVKDAAKALNAPASKRKEKEPFALDFAVPMSQALADALYTPASSTSIISLPKAQWKSKTRNLLPDDKHFNSRQLLRLFLKPKASMGSRKTGTSNQARVADLEPEGEVDEAYWANKEDPHAQQADEDAPQGNYDANFFQDDGLGAIGMDDDDEEFADARDHFSPPAEGLEGAVVDAGSDPAQDFGAQLVTQSRRLRPEYVQYARVAKKVDVRRLKEEIWRGLSLDETMPPPVVPTPKAADESLKFTDVISNLQTVYSGQTMADISTSYCFICLLHLANEKGLEIQNEENFMDLTIRKDHTAEIVSAGD